MSRSIEKHSWFYGPAGITFSNSPAVGNEYKFIEEEQNLIGHHFIAPISAQWANPGLRFQLLKSQVEEKARFSPSMANIAMLPAYQQIIGMGPVALPFILSDLKNDTGIIHWFWALKSITGEDPVPPETRGIIREMSNEWIKWGISQGYIK